MKKITINTSNSYDILVGEGLLEDIVGLSAPVVKGKRALVVCGDNIKDIYGVKVAQSLNAQMYVHKSGESNKNLDTLQKLLSYLSDNKYTRQDVIFALGGGVTGDIAGLAAALYMRGMKLVQVPTTLLAAVDSSVGGKTAINFNNNKNLIGVINQPNMVICDTSCFGTLPYRIYSEGMAEVIKYAIISGENLCDNKDMVSRCIEIKKQFVEADEKDLGQRHILNLGHTIGHALEKITSYEYLHGEAVAIGIAMMARNCNCKNYDEIERMLIAYGLPVSTDIYVEEIAKEAMMDKKNNGNGIDVVVPYAMGDCRIESWTFEKLCELK